ncbi:hypothetical protein ACIOJD_13715 [Streptomyces sp. NPDC088116]|uniref:hypothetical protein n=1 Tax=Streptomyces sp. NPDC088116 TaxID=3365825 RepID=UPI0037FD9625
MALALAVAVCLSTLALGGEELWNRWRADENVRQDDAAQSRFDDTKAPFTTVVERLAEDEYQPDLLIDRPFTPTELRKVLALDMRDSGDIEEFDSMMAKREARRVNGPSWATAMPATASIYQLNIHSEKDDPLTINGLEATNVRCGDISTARTVIRFPHQGEISAAGLLLDLDSRPKTPINTDQDARDAGKPYFSRHGIAVGGTQSPGLVRLEAATGMARCTFHLRARFTNTDMERHSTVITNDGQPFVAESVPQRPEQAIIFSIPDGSFVDCSQRSVSGCSEFRK